VRLNSLSSGRLHFHGYATFRSGRFGLSHFGLGHFDLGHFGVGTFRSGLFRSGDISVKL